MPVLKAVRKKRAYEDIVTQIRNLIEKGRFRRGDQLPTERELSEILKVSRATVREAIFSLEAMKLVDRRQGNGTYVIASSEEALVQPLADSLFQEKDDLLEIFSLRKIIEPEVAHLASENADSEEIAELEKIIERQESEMASPETAVQADTQFHRQLARMTKNKFLERLTLALFHFLRKTREEYLLTQQRKQKSISGHRGILKAIQNGDGRAARQAMLKHIEEVESILFQKKKGGGRKSS